MGFLNNLFGGGGGSSSKSVLNQTLQQIMNVTANAQASATAVASCNASINLSGKSEVINGGTVNQGCQAVVEMKARLKSLSNASTQNQLSDALKTCNFAQAGDPLDFLGGNSVSESDVNSYIKEVTQTVGKSYSKCSGVADSSLSYNDSTKIKKWNNHDLDQNATTSLTMDCVSQAITGLKSYQKLETDVSQKDKADSSLAGGLGITASLSALAAAIPMLLAPCAMIIGCIILCPMLVSFITPSSRGGSKGATNSPGFQQAQHFPGGQPMQQGYNQAPYPVPQPYPQGAYPQFYPPQTPRAG